MRTSYKLAGKQPPHNPQAALHREDIAMLPFTLPLVLTYHDSLYLATEFGVLGLVLLLCWLTPRLDHHSLQPH